MRRETHEFELQGIHTKPDGGFTANAVLKHGIHTDRFERMIQDNMPLQFYFTYENCMTPRPVGKLSLGFVKDKTYRVSGEFFVDSGDRLQLMGVWERVFLFLRTQRLNEDRETPEITYVRIGSDERWRQPRPSVKRKIEKGKKRKKKKNRRKKRREKGGGKARM